MLNPQRHLNSIESTNALLAPLLIVSLLMLGTDSFPYLKAPSGNGSADPIIENIIEKAIVGAAINDRKLFGASG